MAISKRQLGRILLALLSLFIHFGCRSFGPPYHLRPSNDRDWIVEHGRIPHVAFDDNWIHLCNVRDFHHTGKECFHPCYRHISIDSCSIETVDLFISYPVRDPSPFAHTFLSFGTKDSEDFYILSVEARREKGEKYQPIAGMMRKFDLIYVIATERDMLDQRAHWNEEKVHRYPIQVEPRHARSLFVDMLHQVQELETDPQFYNTVKNNCTSNLLKHAEEIGNRNFPDRIIAIMPGYADRFLQRMNLIDDTYPIRCLHSYSLINPLVSAYRCDPDFSRRIRGISADDHVAKASLNPVSSLVR